LLEQFVNVWTPIPPAHIVAAGPGFNLDTWIADYAPDAVGPTDWQGGRRWVFSVCPWNETHTDKSAYIIQRADGAIGAGCHHNGCASRDWHSLRDTREPNWRALREAARVSPTLAEVFIPEPVLVATAPNGNGHSAPTWAAPSAASAPITPATPAAPMPAAISLDRVNECYTRGETGDAELLSALYTDQLAYDHTEKRWHVFTGQHWTRDRRNSIVTYVSSVVAAKYVHAASEHTSKGNPEFGEKLVARAAALRSKKRITDVLTLAQSLSSLALTGEEWDRQPDLLAVANGTLDLRAGIFSDGSPRDYLRVAAPTAWAGHAAPAERWEQFVSEIFNGDAEMVSFIQRLFGYALTGHTTEHILPVFWGSEGRNGKDTLIETLSSVLGNLASVVSKDVVLESFRGNAGGGPTPHLYSLYGLRMAWVSETNKSARLDIGQVKMLTGGGRITARPLHGMPITFTPTHLLCLITNHRPHIPPDEMAMWSRVLLVPFTQRFVDEPTAPNEHQRDPQLKDKLRLEAPGILAWLVRGCLEWRRVGLNPPASVVAAVKDYQRAEDTVGQFIDDCCERVSFAETTTADLYDAFLEWGGKRMDKGEFGKQLGRHGLVSNNNKRARGWTGIRLLAKRDTEQVPTEFAP
jgi:putative DNA primase/helicase